jgi:hypothetical protein
VARALEHAASRDRQGRVAPGAAVATQRLGEHSVLQVVDVLLSGTHEPGTSHHELLRAFVDAKALARMDAALAAQHYRTHEFGDSVWVAAARAQGARSGDQRGQHRTQCQQGGERRDGLERLQCEVLHLVASSVGGGAQDGLQTACAA